MFIGKLLFKTTGLMTKRMRMNTCTKLGETLAQKVITTGEKINADDVSVFLKDIMGKRMKGIRVSTNPDVACEFAVKEVGLPKTTAKAVVSNSLSSVWSSPKTGNALLDLRIEAMDHSEAINTAVHETQHLLNRTSSLKMKLAKLLGKLMPKKVEKATQEYGTVLNLKNQFLQGDLICSLNVYHANVGYVDNTAIKTLLEKFKCKNTKELKKTIREIIREDVIIPKCDKKNLTILKALAATIKDEANSYKVGGIAEKYFDMATGKVASGDTTSETIAKLYEKTVSVLKSEARKQKLNNIKKFFGLKPKEYAIAKNIENVEEISISAEEIEDLINKGYFKNEEEVNTVLKAIKETLYE